MKPLLTLVIMLVLFTETLVLAGQTQSEKAKPQPSGQASAARQTGKPDEPAGDDVVKISVTLVQMDVVVTDRQGRLVTDLKADDFEVFEDGRKQEISNFSFVTTGAESAELSVAPRASSKHGVIVPPVRLRPDQVRRTIALVVDDLSLSFQSTHYVRQALRKYVDEQMQPGDLVAIIRTGRGVGALQQFTSDKRQLYAAIDRVKWNLSGRGGMSAFSPYATDPADRTGLRPSQAGGGTDSTTGATARQAAGDDLERFREEVFTVGTLGAVNYVVRGLSEMPGRKSVVLFSDGVRIFNRSGGAGTNARVVHALRRLTDLANRASVVIYSIDARGLLTLSATAEDDISSTEGSSAAEKIDALANDRRTELIDSQEGLEYLAHQTGGFLVKNNNDIGGGLNRVLNDQKGYYLIGYVPDDDTFKRSGRPDFHSLKIKVKRPGLSVRTRKGFFGVSDEEVSPAKATVAGRMWDALTSPFASGDLQLRLTSLFLHDAKKGPFVRSLLHIDSSGLTFTEEADGWKKASLDVLALTFADDGRVVDQKSNTFAIRVRGETYEDIKRHGFLYNVMLPVKKAGAYQLRVAVRDTTADRIGSANQFIEVPDIKKRRLTLSGLVIDGADANAAPDTEAGRLVEVGAAAAPAGAQSEAAAEATPATRKFRTGMMLDYAYLIYNARLDRATKQPRLETQAVLYRDGQVVYTGKPTPVTGQRDDWTQIGMGGRLKLGRDLPPGEYVLQVIVTDTLAGEKHGVTSQWMDFEIVK